MRRSRRVVYGVVVYGLIGLMVTVLVAWGFAAWGEVKTIRAVTTSEVFKGVERVSRLDWRARGGHISQSPMYEQEHAGPGLRVYAQRDIGPISSFVTEVESGWPFRAMSFARFTQQDEDVIYIYSTRRDWCNLPVSWPPISLENWWPERRQLPIVPVWGGFLADGMFYGLMVWTMVSVGVWWKRKRRMARFLCPICAYDLRGGLGSGCPECGWARAGGAG